ncbi:MAG TPA: YceI family protein [Steroidobacteraceae bacterium]|jgi:polyisoprenoid-binding protein YceI
MANYITVAAALLLAVSAGRAPAAEPAAGGGTRYVQASSGSSLAFTFMQQGAETAGRFKTFATELRYDEADPAQGSLLVRVKIDSVDTQDEERDDALLGPSLFDAESYPAATYVAKSFARTAGGGLEAVGKLTIRGVSKDLRLPLTIKPAGSGLVLSGETSIRRLDFGVGQGQLKSTKSLGDEVKIKYEVALVRAPE